MIILVRYLGLPPSFILCIDPFHKKHSIEFKATPSWSFWRVQPQPYCLFVLDFVELCFHFPCLFKFMAKLQSSILYNFNVQHVHPTRLSKINFIFPIKLSLFTLQFNLFIDWQHWFYRLFNYFTLISLFLCCRII